METTTKLTHWKALTNPDYLGAYVLEPGQDLIVTIKSVTKQMVTGPDGKKEECAIIHFMEPGVKPMICNKTNFKMIAKIHKTPYVEKWPGKQIQLYAREVSAFGNTVEALRIRDLVPQTAQVDVSAAIDTLNACTTLEELKAAFLKLSKQEQSHPDVKSLTESLKLKLQ